MFMKNNCIFWKKNFSEKYSIALRVLRILQCLTYGKIERERQITPQYLKSISLTSQTVLAALKTTGFEQYLLHEEKRWSIHNWE